MKKQIYLLITFVIYTAILSCATFEYSEKSVPHSVEKYMHDNGTDFCNYELSDLGTDNGYNEHKRSYDVYGDIDTLWSDYMKADPCLAFDSRIIEFGVVFNPDDSIIYNSAGGKLPTFSEGQIYILT